MAQGASLRYDTETMQAIINNFIISRFNEDMNRAAPYLQDGELVISELQGNIVERLLEIGNSIAENEDKCPLDPETLSEMQYIDLYDCYEMQEYISKIYTDIFGDRIVRWVKLIQFLEWAAKIAIILIEDCGPDRVNQIVNIVVSLIERGVQPRQPILSEWIKKQGGWARVRNDTRPVRTNQALTSTETSAASTSQALTERELRAARRNAAKCNASAKKASPHVTATNFLTTGTATSAASTSQALTEREIGATKGGGASSGASRSRTSPLVTATNLPVTGAPTSATSTSQAPTEREISAARRGVALYVSPARRTSPRVTTTNLPTTSAAASAVPAVGLLTTCQTVATPSTVRVAAPTTLTGAHIAPTSTTSSSAAARSRPSTSVDATTAAAANVSGNVDFSQYQRNDHCPRCGERKPISKKAYDYCRCRALICMYPNCDFIYQQIHNARRTHIHDGQYSNRNPQFECVCGYPKQPAGGCKLYVKCPNPYCPYRYCRQDPTCDLEFTGAKTYKNEHAATYHSQEAQAKVDVCGNCKQERKIRDGLNSIQRCPSCGVYWCMRYRCTMEYTSLPNAKRHVNAAHQM